MLQIPLQKDVKRQKKITCHFPAHEVMSMYLYARNVSW